MMPDHSSEPVVMFPSSKSWNCINWCNIQTCKNKSSSWSWKSFIMRRYLLWANSCEQVLKIISVWHEQRWTICVIRMNIPYFHVSKSRCIVIVCSIFSLVLSLWNFRSYFLLCFYFLIVCILEFIFNVISNREISNLVGILNNCLHFKRWSSSNWNHFA